MKLKMFTCICDFGDDLEPIRVTRPAESVKDFKERYKGNGEFLKVKEVETALTNDKFEETLRKTLENAGYGKNEIELIIAILQENNK